MPTGIYPHKIVAPEIRFWAKVTKESNGCWNFSDVGVTGYGKFKPIPGEAEIGAHRYAYELLKGPIPKGLHIDHLCRNRRCVNPEHLEAVTQAENNRRNKNTKPCCPHGHLYTPENTYRYKGERYCKQCHYQAMKIYRLKKKIAKEEI